MKKLINKLFGLLGYVPKEEYNDILYTARDLGIQLDWYERSACKIRENNVNYYYEERFRCFLIGIIIKDAKYHKVGYPVKIFPFTDDTKDYARICAEELCDMLNEKY